MTKLGITSKIGVFLKDNLDDLLKCDLSKVFNILINYTLYSVQKYFYFEQLWNLKYDKNGESQVK